MKQITPWYLKKKAVYLFCIVTPPIGYVILLLNLKTFEQSQKMEYLSIATIMMAIWLLKFLPADVNYYVWLIIITLCVGGLLLKLLKQK
ncbi:MAG: hypothetical protein ABS948_08050 [Solibacillus sp.]